MTLVDLSGILPANVIMVISVAASTTSGKKLSEEEIVRVNEACDEALWLDKMRQEVTAYQSYCYGNTSYFSSFSILKVG